MARDIKDMKRRKAAGKGIGATVVTALVAGVGFVAKQGVDLVKDIIDDNTTLGLLDSKKDELYSIKGKKFKSKHDKAKINQLTKEISDLKSKRKR